KPGPRAAGGAAPIPDDPDPERLISARLHRDLAIEDGLASWREEERRMGRTMVPAWHPEAGSAA
ncbi:MAG TPA: hypothetical protein VIR00_15480, partial [Micromonosporaceae bacterium]